MNQADEVPVRISDAALRAQVYDAVERLSTPEASEVARRLGVTPPSSDGRWDLILIWDADGNPPGGQLAWSLPRDCVE